MRKHEGCGIRNPWSKSYIWATSFVGVILSFVLVMTTGSWWGELGLLILPVLLLPVLWWEFVHAPSKMYKTWWP
jgi:hypothetical protein